MAVVNPINAPSLEGAIDWLGVSIDTSANEAGDMRLSPRQAAVATLMISTDEETVLARAAERLSEPSGSHRSH